MAAVGTCLCSAGFCKVWNDEYVTYENTHSIRILFWDGNGLDFKNISSIPSYQNENIIFIITKSNVDMKCILYNTLSAVIVFARCIQTSIY